MMDPRATRPKTPYDKVVLAIEGILASNMMASTAEITSEKHEENVALFTRSLRVSLWTRSSTRGSDGLISRRRCAP